MVKRLGKQKTRSFTHDEQASAARSKPDLPDLVDFEADLEKSPQIRGSVTRDNLGRTPMMVESFDSVHSPFFLHSSDYPGSVIVSHTLDGTNYNSWAIAMRISLDAKNKLSFVDGSLPRPAVDDRLFKIWSRCNSMVKSWLLNVVNQEIYDSILYYEDAAEMWDDLFRRFKVNNLPRKYQLEQAVMSLKQGQLDLSTYFTKKKTLWEQLANTKSRSVKKCDCEQVQELLEEAETSKIIQFLMGLNDNFNNIRGQILNMKPRPGLNDIYNMLDQDESQRSVGNNMKGISNSTAFQMQSATPDNTQILLSHGNFQKPKCSHCHRIGHTVDKCYKVHGYPPGHPMFKKQIKPVGSTNLATASPSTVQASNDMSSYEPDDSMSKEQIQHMIAYLSNKLQVSSSPNTKLQAPSPVSERNFASTSTSVPNISQISGSFTGVDDWSR